MSSSVFAQPGGGGGGGQQTPETDISLTHPSCTTCSDGEIEVTWSYGNRSVYVTLTDSSGSVTNSSGSSPFSFAGLSEGDYTVTYYYYNNWSGSWEEYKSETVILAYGTIEYCSTEGTCESYYYLSNVSIEDIDNSTTCDGYGDYTDLSTDVEIGSSYSIEVEVYNPYDNNVDYRLWVDWNQDGDFSDSSEEISMTEGDDSASATITVPSDAVLGAAQMRVKMMFVDDDDPCQSDDYYGDVEDYTLNVTQDLPSVSLSVVSTSIDEDGESTSISVSLDEVCTEDVVVELSVGGDVSSSDYTLSSTSVTIPAGSTIVKVTFAAVDDSEDEGDEEATVEITSVTSANSVASEAGTQEVSITIVDDDDPSVESIEVDDQSPEGSYSAEDLVEDVLITGCLTASNITFSGDETNGLGYFNQGDSDFPLASGVIMSTGNVNNAEGPASIFSSDANDGFDFDEDDQDSDLVALAGTEYSYQSYGPSGYWAWENVYYDAQILEFDFVPAGDQLEFNYIFASEEYNGYACSDYNDGFAFILSGPGITADTGLTGKNIALTESGDQVSINNVYESQCSGYSDNSEYYVDETGGYSIAFDGRTTVLTASSEVEACETYHIKLIIYDRYDKYYNSAVFLEANSFSSNEVEVDNMIGSVDGNQDVMYEGCEGSFMRFNRAEDYDIDEEIEFALNITGTANNEATSTQDYIYVDEDGDMIDDGVFPTTITIPAGDEYADYYYKAVSDDEVEDDETIIFRIDRCPCDESEYYEKTVTIINSPEVDAVASAAIQCEESGYPTVTITVDLVDGISSADYLYSFDGGLSFGSDNVYTITSTVADGSDLVGTTFDIVVKDLFSCSDNTLSLTTTIPEIEAISADAGEDLEVCYGSEIQISGKGGIYYEWTCSVDGIVDDYLSDANVSNPVILEGIPVGIYEFIMLVQDQEGSNPVCTDQDTMILEVLETPVFTSVTAGDYALCSGEETSLNAIVSMSVSYLWNPSSGLDDETIENPVFSAEVSSEESRSYTLTVTASNGCSAVQSLDNAITVYPNPSILLDEASSNLCADGTDGELHIEVTGGTPNDSSPEYTYEWSHDASLDSTDATSLEAGDYTITVTDSKSCSAEGDYTISAEPKPKGVYYSE